MTSGRGCGSCACLAGHILEFSVGHVHASMKAEQLAAGRVDIAGAATAG